MLNVCQILKLPNFSRKANTKPLFSKNGMFYFCLKSWIASKTLLLTSINLNNACNTLQLQTIAILPHILHFALPIDFFYLQYLFHNHVVQRTQISSQVVCIVNFTSNIELSGTKLRWLPLFSFYQRRLLDVSSTR